MKTKPCTIDTFAQTVRASGKFVDRATESGSSYMIDLQNAWYEWIDGGCDVSISNDGFELTPDDVHWMEELGWGVASDLYNRSPIKDYRLICVVSDITHHELVGLVFVAWDGGDNVWVMSPSFFRHPPVNRFFPDLDEGACNEEKNAIHFFSKEESDRLIEVFNDYRALKVL